jgi:hypothetical protein
MERKRKPAKLGEHIDHLSIHSQARSTTMLASSFRRLRHLRPIAAAVTTLRRTTIASSPPPPPKILHFVPFSSSPATSLSEPILCKSIENEIEKKEGGISEEFGDVIVQYVRQGADTDACAAIELALDSVVKVFTVSSSPNYFLPWQNKAQRESMGSG